MNAVYETPRWQFWLRTGLTWIYLVWCTKQIVDGSIDLMFLTGAGFCIIGFWLGLGSRQRMHEVIDTLRRSATLLIPESKLSALHVEIEKIGEQRARAGLIIVALAEFLVIVTGFLLVPWLVYGNQLSHFLTPTDWAVFLAFVTTGTAAGGLVGWLLGSFTGYSRLPEAVTAMGGSLVVQPFAADGHGGLRALVEFTRRQAALTLLPALWIGLWLILTSLNTFWFLGRWRFPLFFLFALAVLYAAAGFSAPLRAIDNLFRESENFAVATGDERMQSQVRAVRRRMWPGPSSLYVVVAVLSAAIVVSGTRDSMRSLPFRLAVALNG